MRLLICIFLLAWAITILVTYKDHQTAKCRRCVYRESVSNHSPCYGCKGCDRFSEEG